MITNQVSKFQPPFNIMHVTQFFATAFTLAVAAVALPAMSTPVKLTRRDQSGSLVEPTKCNEGGGLIVCSDATAACQQVPNIVSFAKPGETANRLVHFQSADIWLTRVKSSATDGNATALCLEVVDKCCAGGTTMSKSEIALPAGESGSIQVVPS